MRLNEKVYTLAVSAISGAGLQVLIGGQTYYRLRFADLAPIPIGAWGQVKWAPQEGAYWPVTAAGTIQASIGAALATQLKPAIMALWPVDAGSLVLTRGVVSSAVNAPYLLYPGDTLDLGGWQGDIIYAEGVDPAAARADGFDWQNGAFAAALGAAFSIVLDRATGYVAQSGDAPTVR